MFRCHSDHNDRWCEPLRLGRRLFEIQPTTMPQTDDHTKLAAVSEFCLINFLFQQLIGRVMNIL
jgi:hypothetical protein